MTGNASKNGSVHIEEHDVEAVNKAGKRQPLYAARVKVFPKLAQGTFRRFKWLMVIATLGVFFITPWLRWDRGPFAPDQAVLIDVAHRRFYFFFIEIWPQEFYYVAGLLVMAGVGLFLLTSTVGRAWCGYSCWQTVWVDLFLVVERAIEGDRNARIKLDKAPWSGSKFGKRLLKHAVWLMIAVATGLALILYFADAPGLVVSFLSGQAPGVAYMTVAILTATTYAFAGLLREQVCTYMCPWPRIQAAMLDEHSLTVTYNEWRGEPRTKHAKKALAAGEEVGDCIECNACVAVCPMGIDIRDGQQLECITCALCIDACDNVMDKLGKERGLVSYATLNDYNANMALAMTGDGAVAPSRIRDGGGGNLISKIKHTEWRSFIRPRSILYTGIWVSIGLAMLVVLALRSPLDINVLHDRNPLYVMLSDGQVRNGYDVKILNMTPKERTVRLFIEGLPGAMITTADASRAPVNSMELDLEPDKVLPLRVYVRADPAGLSGPHTDVTFRIENIDNDERAETAAKFEAPGGS